MDLLSQSAYKSCRWNGDVNDYDGDNDDYEDDDDDDDYEDDYDDDYDDDYYDDDDSSRCWYMIW